MYRRYEDPTILQARLDALKMIDTSEWGEEELFDLQREMAELEERINFAWQDDEAEMEGWE